MLTDGASALYGGEAIAGVINFILKKNHQGLTLDAGYVQPEHGRQERQRRRDLWLRRSRVERLQRADELPSRRTRTTKAPQRRLAATSYIPFSNHGVNYIYDRTSTSTVPPNATVSFTDPKANKAIGFDISKQWNVRVGIKNPMDKFIAWIRPRTAIDEQYVRERSEIKNAPKGVFFGTPPVSHAYSVTRRPA